MKFLLLLAVVITVCNAYNLRSHDNLIKNNPVQYSSESSSESDYIVRPIQHKNIDDSHLQSQERKDHLNVKRDENDDYLNQPTWWDNFGIKMPDYINLNSEEYKDDLEKFYQQIVAAENQIKDYFEGNSNYNPFEHSTTRRETSENKWKTALEHLKKTFNLNEGKSSLQKGFEEFKNQLENLRTNVKNKVPDLSDELKKPLENIKSRRETYIQLPPFDPDYIPFKRSAIHEIELDKFSKDSIENLEKKSPRQTVTLRPFDPDYIPFKRSAPVHESSMMQRDIFLPFPPGYLPFKRASNEDNEYESRMKHREDYVPIPLEQTASNEDSLIANKQHYGAVKRSPIDPKWRYSDQYNYPVIEDTSSHSRMQRDYPTWNSQELPLTNEEYWRIPVKRTTSGERDFYLNFSHKRSIYPDSSEMDRGKMVSISPPYKMIDY